MQDSFFDVPAGYRDADLEMAALTASGNKASRLRKMGKCPHTWLQGFEGQPTKCLDCGAMFPTLEAAYEAHREAMNS